MELTPDTLREFIKKAEVDPKYAAKGQLARWKAQLAAIPNPADPNPGDILPLELRRRKQWVVWRYEERNGKKTKVPYQVNGSKAESNDPSTWTSYAAVNAASGFDGIGIMFGDGLAGIDLDHKVNEKGQITKFARDIVRRMDTYTEYSPSGTGLHLLFLGEIPAGRRKDTDIGFEIYTWGRFFTVTGKRFNKADVNERTAVATEIHREVFPDLIPPTIQPPIQPTNLDDLAILDLAMNSKNGAKFNALYSGDHSDYASQSEADLALCSMLTFWTGGDAGQVDRLFRSSGLMRPKWDERHSETATYGAMTIAKAMQGVTEYYHPGVEIPDLENKEILQILANERFAIRDMAYAMQPRPARDWRVKNLLPAGHVAVLSAWTGSGKTWVAYELAVCVALGSDWMGFETVPGACLIINEEMDEYDMYERLSKCNHGHYGDRNTQVKTISFARFNLFNERNAKVDVALIKQVIIECDAKLVIIDALADVMAGGDENQVKDTQAVFMLLSDIAKRTQCVILVLHHTGKNGATRGSSAIPGAVDLAILMKRSAESSYLNFETEKARVIPATKWVGKMTWGEDFFYTELFDNHKEKSQALGPKEQAVIEYIKGCENEQAYTADIARETGVSRATITGLAAKGVIQRLDKGGRGTPSLYEVVTCRL